MKKIFFSLAVVAALSACSQTPAQVNAKVANVVAAVCAVDGLAQPVVVALAAPIVSVAVPGSAPAVAAGVALDNAVVHPAITAACATVGGVPVAVVPAVTAPVPAGVPAVVVPAAVVPAAAVAK